MKHLKYLGVGILILAIFFAIALAIGGIIFLVFSYVPAAVFFFVIICSCFAYLMGRDFVENF